jgi:glycine/D-amino acid oxidase-like deaminating enzyme
MPDGTARFATLPVAIVGAGPVGLAAAAELVGRGIMPLVLDAGAAPGASVAAWGHVRMFSPWRYNIPAAGRALLDAAGWRAPDLDHYPTGHELVRDMIVPLATHPAIAPHLRTGARVIGITRRDHDVMRDGAREAAPFVLQVAVDGGVEELAARAVIDASGTWASPNPAGAHGLKVPGEQAAEARMAYGIPDVLGAERATYAGTTTLVVGSGHSAMNVVLDLDRLAQEAPGTRILWALRRAPDAVNFGGGAADALAERGALGAAAQRLAEAGRAELLAPFRIVRIAHGADGLAVTAGDGRTVHADRIIVAAGFRPDLSFLRELRVALAPGIEAPPALAPLIDPNVHSCGTVRPHGEAELRHPEAGFYIAGMKSYGRAPTFLLATGYEQVRSIVAHLAGDEAAARAVRLDLPETGVCSGAPALPASAPDAGCCTPTTPQGVCCPPKPELAAAAPCCG